MVHRGDVKHLGFAKNATGIVFFNGLQNGPAHQFGARSRPIEWISVLRMSDTTIGTRTFSAYDLTVQLVER